MPLSLIVRGNLIHRVYTQRTGDWKPGGEGVEQVAPAEWAAALDLLAGGRERAFVCSAKTLLGRGNAALALKLIDLGEIRYPSSIRLIEQRKGTVKRGVR